MKILKNFNNFKLNEDADSGYLQLIIDGEAHSNWFYLRDAIENGLLEEYFDLDDIIYEMPWEYEVSSISDITDIFEIAFEQEDFSEIDHMLNMFEKTGYVMMIPKTITIVGETEDGDKYDVTYER